MNNVIPFPCRAKPPKASYRCEAHPGAICVIKTRGGVRTEEWESVEEAEKRIRIEAELIETARRLQRESGGRG